MGRVGVRGLSVPAVCLAALLALGGCGSEPPQMGANGYENDGYLGMTQTNPNFRMNPTHHNYTKDRQLMRQALRQIGLDKRSTILINGASATVTIRLDGEVAPEEAEAIRSDAYLLLKGNVPRYDYRIRLE